MSLRERIPVEPLDEQRLTNIERRLVARAGDIAQHPVRAPRRWGLALGAFAAAAAAGVIGWTLHRAPAPTTLGDVPLAVATDHERSTLDIGDATIASDPATQFAVTRPAGGVLVAMQHGKVELEVQKRGSRPPLVVRAGDTDVEVVGTHFSVAWDGKGPVEVRVTEGKVRVKRLQQETLVAAGQAWRSTDGLVALRTIEQAPGSVAASDDIQIDTAGEPGDRDHAPTAPEGSGTHAASSEPGSGSSHVASSGSGGGSKPGSPFGNVRKAIEKQPLEPALAVDGNPLQAYSAIVTAQPPAAEASAAFYSMALLQYEAKRDDDALRTLDGYFRRFSGGTYSGTPHYQAALWLRLRILCLRSLDDRCRQAAYQYSKQVNSGPKAGIADQIEMTP
jgi:hypothetical protein